MKLQSFVPTATALAPWLIISLLTSFHHYWVGQEHFRDKAELLGILLFNVPLWCLWWPGHKAVKRWANRWRLSSSAWRRPLLVHFGGSLAILAILLLLTATWSLVAFPHPLRPATSLSDALLFFASGTSLLVHGLIYWLLLAIEHARFFLEEIRERDIRQSQLEAQLSRARLNALKMQLQPHFLFNSLNAIVSLIHRREPTRAVGMLNRLSHFLRMTLEDTGEQEIPLRRELAFAECYMSIETTRFPSRLDYRVEVEAKVLDHAVPNLLLQPLLENAVHYAVGPTGGRGRLTVRCRSRSDRLCVVVQDEGAAGLIPNNASSGHGGSGLGIGLANTRQRLHLLYGDNHRLELKRRHPRGAEVRLEIPLRRMNNIVKKQELER